ncbi:ATP-dependent translocase ABCB1-like [Ischnura elegans]|uniref:ATP-dependent translocase ABCB1-like n=1 Tax=Ischnura elegans TaxID=197161 RepID=UPI001ED8AC61|nr:ATP-dependent translocase ABCB1-like [Ischnura elegans]XP_046390851.1 ATP-dependent translocase ABCB1-like [Ischnura elegans]
MYGEEKENYENNIRTSLYRKYNEEIVDPSGKTKDNAVLSFKAEPVETKEEENKNVPPQISYYKLFRYSSALDRCLMLLGTLSALVTGLCQPANTLLFGDLTGTMVDKGSQLMAGAVNVSDLPKIKEDFLDSINTFAIGNSIIGAIMLLCSYISVTTFNYAAQRQIFHIRRKFLEAALRQDIGWYDTHQTGDFASRMTEDLSKIEEGLGEKVVMFFHFQVAFIGSIILALVKGWELALICLISFPVTLISVGVTSRIASVLSRKEVEAYGKAGSIAEEVLSSIRSVIAYGGQDKESERYSKNLVFAKDNNIKRSFVSGLGMGILWFCIYSSYALAFWYGVGLIIDERDLPEEQRHYTTSTMVTVFFGVMMGSMNFGQSSPYFETFAMAKGSAGTIFALLSRTPPIDSTSTEGEKLKKVTGEITFEGIHFNYPSRPDVKILRGLTLTINKGQTTALVGSSGCGKSTCIQLIQRFYDPMEGKVKLDGHDLKDLNVNWLRTHIGVVGQEPVLFATTIAENIRYGRDGVTNEDIETAAKEANAHDFIMKLPQKYETMVGERGAQMSGGQKQRIAIARALVRRPDILLLDEATSALDTGSEAKVQEALDKASQGRTTVIVAHRLSTIRGADKIAVLHEGVVVEEGTHTELMARGGHYYDLVNAQINSGGDEDEEDGTTEVERHFQRTISQTSAKSSQRSSIVEADPSNLSLGATVEEKDDEEVSASLTQIIKLNKPEWVYILIGGLTSGVMGCSMPVFSIIFGDILGVLAEPNPRDEANLYCIYFVIVGIIVGIATLAQMYSFGVAGEKLTMRLRSLMFDAMVRQEVGWFDDKENSTGALCARLSGEASSVQGATGSRIGTILQSVATVILAVVLALYYEWRLGLVTLVFCPFIIVAIFLQRRVMMGETLSNKSGIEKSSKLAVEAIGNIRTVAGLCAEPKFVTLYVKELDEPHRLALRNTHFRGIVFGIARGIVFFAYATSMYYGGQLVANEGLEFSRVFKVSQSLIMGTFSVANAMAFAPNFERGLIAAERVFKLLARKPLITDPRFPVEQWEAKGNASFSQVKFYYPTRMTVNVLKGLDLVVKKGQTLALVGASGCGKSTCIQLLERFYDPVSGTVAIDERDVSTVALRDLRSQMGIVSQEPTLFDRTIAENIAYGDNSRQVPMEEIIEAARKANIHTFITNLPQGYDTSLGEKGTQLSGGQKQRVAIARALVRNPKILLLDEATSALDTESERVVQEALDKAKEGRTCITIAHRLSTIVDSDAICVIDNGRVAEMGTHQQLLNRKGLYHRLYTLQGGRSKNS